MNDALGYVAGYTVFNDVSARDVQVMKAGDGTYMDWFSGKSMQNTSPIGPYITTADEVSNPQELQLRTRVNNELMQDEGTHLMIKSVAELVSYVSSRVELQPGDVISTGTPEGVGESQDIRLMNGDTVEVEIDGVGALKNRVNAVE